ncbi:DUF3363 domain-containing protein [Bradyrhizobium sp. CCGUVB23]|uniref:DUF3363 domain-containing protein n=1 Tax=Bradyrhizobium sp. CCGUVB23 TaxID=2949630 RepID=UPI0020B3E074|nr:DUF3363 domain-containing protein [Bradyrhizobium sp. CCGUVB23]MCP3468233.1 DUF3363 domain-containing protein [Bradyrhizobium sp. CCGUVB23]
MVRRQRLVGRIVGEGLSDELRERRYVVLEGVDVWTHCVEIGRLSGAVLIRTVLCQIRTVGISHFLWSLKQQRRSLEIHAMRRWSGPRRDVAKSWLP